MGAAASFVIVSRFCTYSHVYTPHTAGNLKSMLAGVTPDSPIAAMVADLDDSQSRVQRINTLRIEPYGALHVPRVHNAIYVQQHVCAATREHSFDRHSLQETYVMYEHRRFPAPVRWPIVHMCARQGRQGHTINTLPRRHRAPAQVAGGAAGGLWFAVAHSLAAAHGGAHGRGPRHDRLCLQVGGRAQCARRA